ncbi:MAG: MBL fold metallo-hydrolase [Salibacteraceae bacterium]
MEDFIVTFLGTGTSQGVPMIACDCKVCQSCDQKDKRLRSSILIKQNDVQVVIDTGPDFRYQMLREKVKRLDAVVFTHEHKDHVAGLDDIRGFNYFMKSSMSIFATERVQKALKREFYYAFESEKYPGVPQLELKTILNKPFDVLGVKFTPIEMTHFKMPVFGYRVGDFAYLTDANAISEKELKKLIGVKVLVINALREAKHISHFSLEEALHLIKQINPKEAYLTHLSHQMPRYQELIEMLPENVFPAYDGLKLKIC